MTDFAADKLPAGAFEDRADAGRRLADALLHLKDESADRAGAAARRRPGRVRGRACLGGSARCRAGAKDRRSRPEGTWPRRGRRWGTSADRAERGCRARGAAGRRATSKRNRRANWPRSSAAGRSTGRAVRRWTVEGRTVIVVDDGIATGGTVKAVLKALRESHPRKLVLAVPGRARRHASRSSRASPMTWSSLQRRSRSTPSARTTGISPRRATRK